MLGKLLLIHWMDAASSDGWAPLRDHAAHRPKLCLTVGWCIVDDAQFLTTVPLVGEEYFGTYNEDALVAQSLTVPRGMISKVEVLS